MTENCSVKIKTPHDLIIEKDVIIALKNENGPEASLKSFEIKDFTSKGDNYICAVSSVEVCYTENGVDKESSYIVKLNPCRSQNSDAMSKLVFEKETGFYTIMLPILNGELTRANERKLRIPACFHYVEETSFEVIYLEDMRRSGFKMNDRKKGMDKDHVELVLSELARLHASSSLLMSRGEFRGADMVKKFPLLKEGFVTDDDDKVLDVKPLMEGFFENGIQITKRLEGYGKVEEFLTAHKSYAFAMVLEDLKYTDQFKVITHGDCWNNNFLFRYSPEGQVVDCCLLDMQITRISSPALDLNYMLYSSLNGEVRQLELTNFLTKYYASFASVVAGSGTVMKFTLEELVKEFYAKNMFGFIMGLMLVPVIIIDAEDATEMPEFSNDKMQEMLKEMQKKSVEQIQKNPLLKPRLLALFDEMIASGVIQ